MKKKELAGLLRRNVEIPLLEDRLRILQCLRKTVVCEYGADFSKIIGTASVPQLPGRLLNSFPFFRDAASYGGRAVPFNKRAQLLVSDVNRFHGVVKLDGVDELTACADYKLPQVLRGHGILE